jgi:pantoate--beta-alanine ligase
VACEQTPRSPMVPSQRLRQLRVRGHPLRPGAARRCLRRCAAEAGPAPLRVFETVGAYRAYRGALPPGAGVGLVATMGYLHDGHLALARAARRECDVVVATIFVNPTQFAAHEDLDTYPQDTERDLELLRAAGVDAVLLPARDEVYGAGHSVVVDPGPDFESLAEGAARGGHFFRGVATVVAKLFNITQPTRAYFGCAVRRAPPLQAAKVR